MISSRAPRLFVSQPVAMESKAGWYVGRLCYEEGYSFCEPYDRESGYFKTKEEAEIALREDYPNSQGRLAGDLRPGLPTKVEETLAEFDAGAFYPSTVKENARAATTLGRYLQKRIKGDTQVFFHKHFGKILEFKFNADKRIVDLLGRFAKQDEQELEFVYDKGDRDAVEMLIAFVDVCKDIRSFERDLVAQKIVEQASTRAPEQAEPEAAPAAMRMS